MVGRHCYDYHDHGVRAINDKVIGVTGFSTSSQIRYNSVCPSDMVAPFQIVRKVKQRSGFDAEVGPRLDIPVTCSC